MKPLSRGIALAVAALAASALGSATVAAGTTAQERMLKAVGKFVSRSADKPTKGLCVCMSDAIPSLGAKRVGLLQTGQGTKDGDWYIMVVCTLPRFDDSGERILGPSVSCGDWLPLAK